jgi:uncharacterized damage-inducible protein DinB
VIQPGCWHEVSYWGMKDEMSALRGALDGQREHVLGILEDLPDTDMRRAILPTGWSCAGLANHLALDVERFWFRGMIAGDLTLIDGYPDAWQVEDGTPIASVLDRYRAEIARANSVIAATTPDAAPAKLPSDIWPGMRASTVREIMLHAITETACHTGHLDAARELIDGRTWMILT